MGLPLIQDEELHPGDLVEVEYEVLDSINFLEDAAISAVKREVAKDPRFHYQSGRIEYREDPMFGRPYQALVIVVQVADPSKVTGNNPDPGPVQQAGWGAPTVIAVMMVVAAGLYAYTVTYKGYVIQRLAKDPNLSDATKREMVRGLGIGGSWGWGAMGGSLGTLAIVLVVLWGLSLLHGRDS